MVPNVENTKKGQDQDAWPRPRHLEDQDLQQDQDKQQDRVIWQD